MRASGMRAVVVVLLGVGTLVLTPSPPAGAEGNEAPGAPEAYRSLAAGDAHTCAIRLDGAVRCWGSNTFGQLGRGSTDARGDAPGEIEADLPVDLGTGRTATAITAGGDRTCALLDNGRVKCWGDNFTGGLGLGDGADRGDAPGEMGDDLPAIDLGTGRTATAITTGLAHTCALLDNGRVKCWGANNLGQLGQGDTSDRGNDPGEMGNNLPAVALGTGRTATAIAAGRSHTCALLDNARVKCWGANDAGGLGYGDTDNRGDAPGEMGNSLPAVALGTGRTATAIAAGRSHTCALLDNARVKCWGRNLNGGLGYGDTDDRGDAPGEMGSNLPTVALGTDRTATGVSAGGGHTCIVANDGQLRCWGFNAAGRLGQGDTDDRGDGPGEMGNALLPVDIGTGRTTSAVTTGESHSCALVSDATLRCWGVNAFGQLGQGDAATRGDEPGEMGDALPPVHLPAHNDHFLDAQMLDGAAGAVRGANPNTDKQPGEPDHGGFAAADSTVWYRWSTTVAGPTRINTLGSGFDTVLAVYTGNDLADLTPIAANDDTIGNLQSQVRFTATAFTEYVIVVAGFNGTSGPITLNWRQIGPCDGRTVTVARAFGDTPTPGNDVIAGTTATETINGQAGNDRICGLNGNDTLIGGADNDRLLGAAGTDTLQGGTGTDHLSGGPQRDTCNGGPQNDTHTGCEVRSNIP